MDRRDFLKAEAERLAKAKKIMAESGADTVRELQHLKSLLEEFNKTEIAGLFRETLRNRLHEIDKNLRTADTIEEVKFLQGEGNGVSFWEILPEIMLERVMIDLDIAKAQLKETEEES